MDMMRAAALSVLLMGLLAGCNLTEEAGLVGTKTSGTPTASGSISTGPADVSEKVVVDFTTTTDGTAVNGTGHSQVVYKATIRLQNDTNSTVDVVLHIDTDNGKTDDRKYRLAPLEVKDEEVKTSFYRWKLLSKSATVVTGS